MDRNHFAVWLDAYVEAWRSNEASAIARLFSEKARYFYGPPLPNPQVAGTRRARELLVTTFDRERRVGALYRLIDGRAELFAGGTPERGRQPILRQPEGVAVDGSGNVYVADRAQGLVIRLDADGRVVDPRHLAITRPRLLAVDDSDRLWVGSDGTAEAPIQQGPGEAILGDGVTEGGGRRWVGQEQIAPGDSRRGAADQSDAHANATRASGH